MICVGERGRKREKEGEREKERKEDREGEREREVKSISLLCNPPLISKQN